MPGLGKQFLRNVYTSWLGYAIRAVVAFLFVPYVTTVLGDSRYGVWVIIFQTINYFSLLDIGMSSAITRYVSKFLSKRDFGGINRVLNTSNLAYLALGSLALAGVYLFTVLFFDYFKIGDPALAEEGRKALLVLGLFIACSFYLLPFGNTLVAFQRQDIAAGLKLVEELVRTAIMVWLLSQGYGLLSLALSLVAVSLARHLVALVWLKKLYPQLRFAPRLANAATATMLLGYSKISFGITVAWLVIFNTDVFLLGLLNSAAAAGIYYPGAQLLLHFRNLVNSIGTPLIPAISHLDATASRSRINEVYFKGLRYTSYLSFLLAVGLIAYARSFVGLWLAPEFAETAVVIIVLAVGAAVFLPQIIGNSVLFGIEKHRYVLYVLAVEAVAKIILALILVGKYGLLGMALASAIPQVVIYLSLFPWLLARQLQISFVRLVWCELKSGLAAVMVAVPISILVRHLLPPDTWAGFAINIAVVVLITGAIGYRFVLRPDDRLRVIEFFYRR
ncbi:MAG: oligosaccharide flippase family protein [candidate division Zixibacteria bacterium]|nr:oligosaccharide flippase family protein [candidate division Zixibacteria bacterium]